MIKYSLVFGILLIIQISVWAQETKKPDFVKAVEDNSFFIEEAYNQEDHVIQHINNGSYSLNSSHNFVYTFTQEWPVFSQKHQFSYSLGFSTLNSGNIKGFDDIVLNYRYQLTGHDDFITLAPRLSLIIPAGDTKKGLGFGVVGYQFNLPLSKRISNGLAVHANIGYTILPNVRSTDINGLAHKNSLSVLNFGASAIWLVTYKTNLMLEVLHNISQNVNDTNHKLNTGLTIISPGIRYAIDIKNLEIVPGLALPFTVQNGRTEAGLFFYLSFEHPFWHK